MAFAIGTSTDAGADTSTFSHTTGTLTDGLLVVLIAFRDSNDNASSVTYDGVAMTRANNSEGNGLEADIWYLLNPNPGTHDVVVNGTLDEESHIVAATFSGVAQSSPLDQTVDGTGTGANPSINVTPTTNSQLIVAALAHESGSAPTTGTGEISLGNFDDGTWTSGFSYSIQHVATTQAINWTVSADSWAAATASFKTSGVKIDAVTSIAAQASTDPWTWSHTVANEDNRALVVGVQAYNQHPTGVTYNGDALTQAQATNNGIAYSSIWYRANPDVGTANISVDFSGVAYGRAGGISFYGVDQGSLPDSSAAEQGTSATTNVLNITTNADNCYIIDSITLDTSLTNTGPIAASDQTANYGSSAATFVDAGMSYKSVGNAGTQTMTETWTVAASVASYGHTGLAFAPADESPADLSVAPSDSVTITESKSVVLLPVEHQLDLSNPLGWRRGVRIWP